MSNTTTFKTRATRSTRGEIWCITVDLLDITSQCERNAARREIGDQWQETKTTWTLRDISPSALLFLAEELEYWGDPDGFWDHEVMQQRRAFPRLAREIREHLQTLTS